MLRSYIRIAFRSLKQRLGVTALNVVGLALGLTACLLIALWVQHELSYDRFHPESDRIARVFLNANVGDRSIEGPAAPAPIATTLQADYPAVESATILQHWTDVGVRIGDRSLMANGVVETDTSFFNVFGGFRFVHGNRDTALEPTDAVVLTEDAAQRFFGETNPVGKTLALDDETLRVTGIIENVPAASHIDFEAVARLNLPEQRMTNWISNSFFSYLKLRPGTSIDAFEPNLQDIVETYTAPQFSGSVGMTLDQLRERGGQWAYALQALPSIHLDSNTAYEIQPGGSRATVYAFLAIGAFILLIACINFMNLATARATERATEVGMRKALGAGRGQLTRQFLGESLLTTFIAGGLAVGAAVLLQPLFNTLADTTLHLETLATGLSIAAIVGVLLVVGIASGAYPAFVLSNFSPQTVLKSAGRQASGGHGVWLRRGLVAVQFTLSVALIAGMLVVERQFEYIQTKELGLDTERVVTVNRVRALGSSQDLFVDRLRSLSTVTNASLGSGLFGQATAATGFIPDDGTEATAFSYVDVRPGFAETLDIEVVAGRTFDPSRSADSSAVLINQAAAERLGWTSPDGHTLQQPGSDSPVRPVIGIVEDFHYQSLRQTVEPLVLRFGGYPQTVYARLAAGDVNAGLDAVRETWNDIAPGEPFDYAFLDQTFAAQHRTVERAGSLFSVFAGLALFIACLGLFGLAAYTAERRTKEIGIRKALGATSRQIVMLLTTDTVKLIGIAFVVGAPLAYWGMQRWLEDFAYRFDLGMGVFLLAGATTLAIALLTVGTQAFRAARLDPAHTLRDE
jgi:putative ABC transport system permease protein